jgi:hypothetical protein
MNNRSRFSCVSLGSEKRIPVIITSRRRSASQKWVGGSQLMANVLVLISWKLICTRTNLWKKKFDFYKQIDECGCYAFYKSYNYSTYMSSFNSFDLHCIAYTYSVTRWHSTFNHDTENYKCLTETNLGTWISRCHWRIHARLILNYTLHAGLHAALRGLLFEFGVAQDFAFNYYTESFPNTLKTMPVLHNTWILNQIEEAN